MAPAHCCHVKEKPNRNKVYCLMQKLVPCKLPLKVPPCLSQCWNPPTTPFSRVWEMSRPATLADLTDGHSSAQSACKGTFLSTWTASLMMHHLLQLPRHMSVWSVCFLNYMAGTSPSRVFRVPLQVLSTGRNREISPQQRLQWCTWAEEHGLHIPHPLLVSLHSNK